MNFFIVILNRVYFILTKIKNQSPLFGASVIVSLLVFFNIGNIILFKYSFSESYHKINIGIGLFVLLIIFTIVFLFAKSKKQDIINDDIEISTFKKVVIIVIFLFTAILFIFLANINRQKIFKERKEVQSNEPKKESLEGKIRKWFEE